MQHYIKEIYVLLKSRGIVFSNKKGQDDKKYEGINSTIYI